MKFSRRLISVTASPNHVAFVISLVSVLPLLVRPAELLAQSTSNTKNVLIVVGPSSHPPGTHEVGAGGRLLKHCVENVSNVANLRAQVVTEWPRDKAVRDSAATVVFIGDTFPPMRLPDSQHILDELGEMMSRGRGIVCVHYATGLRAEDVTETGDHPLLNWMGGYFATRCKHHQSIARIFEAATISPAAAGHPVMRGWKEFTIHDEPYINNYFGKEGMRPGVVSFATSRLPPADPKVETVAWGIERSDGGRGMGIVMPHFYRNWRNDDLRTFILNGIVWTAKLDVPTEGVRCPPPDLSRFQPDSVEPKPREKKAQ